MSDLPDEVYECAGCGGEVPVVDAIWLRRSGRGARWNDDAWPFCSEECFPNARARLTVAKSEIDRLREQRDALVDALHKAQHAMRHPTGPEQEWKDVLESQALAAIDAALSRAQEPKP